MDAFILLPYSRYFNLAGDEMQQINIENNANFFDKISGVMFDS
jgi:hypothetical protein